MRISSAPRIRTRPRVYLLDTNVVSEIRKSERADRGVRAFFRRALEQDIDLYLSVVTVGELRRGVDIVRHRGDAAQAALLETWLTGVLGEFKRHILPVDEDVGQL